jgi:hypothetical protein
VPRELHFPRRTLPWGAALPDRVWPASFDGHEPTRAGLAGDFDPQVLGRHPQAVGAVRAVDIHAHLLDPMGPLVEAQNEVSCALFARDFLPEKFAIDAQLAAAMRAMDVIAPQRQLDDGLDFLERHELWNLDTVGVEIRIEECPAIAAMNELFGHLFAALRTWTTWPRGHFVFLLKREISSAGARSPAERDVAPARHRSHFRVKHNDIFPGPPTSFLSGRLGGV